MGAAGRFDQRVTIKRIVEVVNEFGERTQTTIAAATRWAEVKPLSGSERDYAARVAADLSYQVILRAPVDIRQTDKIAWGSRTLEVAAILDPPRRGDVTVQCKELT